MRNYIQIDSKQRKRLDEVRDAYKALYQSPKQCRPMFIINVRAENSPTWEQKLADPLVMLKSQLDNIASHLELEDDFLPAVRVDFGTGQIASAFGCDIVCPENNLPAVRTHPLKSVEDIYNLQMPALDAGLYGEVFKWIEIWKQNLPDWVRIQHPDIQHPDIQSPFNNAHLIRGNDILTDFYDKPDAVEYLLDVITDYMIVVIRNINRLIKPDNGWFCDWGGGYWKGSARISNCSSDMISPGFYSNFVLPRDIRFLRAIGGGRIHYCGSHTEVIEQFFKNPEVTGLDVDGNLHDLWQLAEKAPDNLVLAFQSYEGKFAHIDRLLAGDFPNKRNIIIYSSVETIEEGKELLARLRDLTRD